MILSQISRMKFFYKFIGKVLEGTYDRGWLFSKILYTYVNDYIDVKFKCLYTVIFIFIIEIVRVLHNFTKQHLYEGAPPGYKNISTF